MARPSDIGLFLATYFGYWVVGLAMLAIGMVASFLTGNLTVGFVLGALFNTPLVFAASADVILPTQLSPDSLLYKILPEALRSMQPALAIRQWSLAEQFRDFGRGVISLPSLVYFGVIVAVMLYLSMVADRSSSLARWPNGNSLGAHILRPYCVAHFGRDWSGYHPDPHRRPCGRLKRAPQLVGSANSRTDSQADSQASGAD